MFKYFFLFQLAALLLAHSFINYKYSESLLAVFVTVSFINSFCFFYSIRTNLNNNIHITVFCIGYLIVFFQNYLEILLGIIAVDDIPRSIASHAAIIRCASLSTIGLVGFFAGVSCIPPAASEPLNAPLKDQVKHSPLVLEKFLIMFSAFAVFLISNYPYLINVQYSQELLESRSWLSNISLLIFQYFVILYLAFVCFDVMCRKQKITLVGFLKCCGWPLNIFTSLFVAALFIGGDRGGALAVVLPYIVAFLLVSKRKVSYKTVLLGCVIGCLFLGIIARFRSINSAVPLSERIIESVEINPNAGHKYTPTYEMARSVVVFHNIVEFIPQEHPYLYGYFHFWEIANIIPGVARIHKMLCEHFRYWSSSYFCTWLYFGDNYPMGMGTAWNADLYMNYGLWGVLIGSFGWGWWLARIRNQVQYKSPSVGWIICYLVISSVVLISGRGSFFCFIRTLIHMYILYFVYNCIATACCRVHYLDQSRKTVQDCEEN